MDVIYFELDNWFAGWDYPNAEPFLTWMDGEFDCYFLQDDWCKKNKLCVKWTTYDMSICVLVTATRAWVEENCPLLLTDEECGEGKHSCKYSKFVCDPEEGWLSGMQFLEYKEENFGAKYVDEE